jgi:predicted O-methyltransferase YrrM
MYSFKLFLKYFVYLLTAKSRKGHGIHSPFLFKLVTAVLNDSRIYKEFQSIEEARSLYYSNTEVIVQEDFGDGSGFSKSSEKRICEIARKASTKQKYGELLFRLVRFYQPKNIIEYGTSLGLGTLYIAKAAPNSAIISMEGSEELSLKARQMFKFMGINNVRVINGEFKMLAESGEVFNEPVDFVYFDGCHTKEMTLYLFEKTLLIAGESSVFVFDDIRWSAGMEDAWKHISADKRVSLSIDLFYIGLVFFNKGISKQHIAIKY